MATLATVNEPIQQLNFDDHLIALWLFTHHSHHTQRAYKADIERLRQFVHKPLNQVSLEDLIEFSKSLSDLGEQSRYRTICAIKSFFRFAHQTGRYQFDVGEALTVPNPPDNLAYRILPEEDIRHLLDAAKSERDKVLLELLYASGIRVAELCGLRVQDLFARGDSGQITVHGKGDKIRSILLPNGVWNELVHLTSGKLPHERVFGISESQVWRIVKKTAKLAGVDGRISPHWFRHAHGSHALDHGAPLHLVQATLGHVSISTTGRYLHARPQDSSGSYLTLEGYNG